MSGAVVWTLVALGLAVLVVRRRSLAVALVTAQALVLVGFALDEAEGSAETLMAFALDANRWTREAAQAPRLTFALAA